MRALICACQLASAPLERAAITCSSSSRLRRNLLLALVAQPCSLGFFLLIGFALEILEAFLLQPTRLRFRLLLLVVFRRRRRFSSATPLLFRLGRCSSALLLLLLPCAVLPPLRASGVGGPVSGSAAAGFRRRLRLRFWRRGRRRLRSRLRVGIDRDRLDRRRLRDLRLRAMPEGPPAIGQQPDDHGMQQDGLHERHPTIAGALGHGARL